ncbi:aurora kinase a [Lichtheimia corymbifera JMRC:FSU:9682]|uniref:Aurora kinase n=1 Tax=Lichtheimia corymbifera JMRC:FSU:9682 TaxID=1263082 RepID=A0A068S4E3_9FUNG|nr:aurora kinase a [Lichtheimia corymbifera JMRC:FSU:9682]
MSSHAGNDRPTMTPMNDPPLSVYVDYTPRRTRVFNPTRADPLHDHSLSRQKRAEYFHRLAQQEPDDDNGNVMDSPSVRRYHGVSATVKPVEATYDPSKGEALSMDDTPRTRAWTIEDFEVGKHLGNGRFGTVYLAKEKSSEQLVALKIIKKQEMEANKIVSFLQREVEIQGHLRHPNILRLYGYFHDEQNVYIVLEYAEKGALNNMIQEHSCLSEKSAAKLMLQVISALKYLHALRVIHRDIKPENLLVDWKGRLKLADFGWAVHDPWPRRRTFCGTLDYLSPEMVENKTHDERVDVWAIGILCYEMLVGYPPFETEHDDYAETYQSIVGVRYTFPEHLSAQAKDFIFSILQKEPSKRPKLVELEKHPWLKAHTQS